MGDDLLDLPIMKRVGLSACPSDAVREVRSRVDYVSRAAGGNGAARDFIEFVLKAQGRWTALVSSYLDDEPNSAGIARNPGPRARTVQVARAEKS
jgi:3-deoxy-D-manno-octulosonate 8-phosphate phosphatase (KDO 8-P phosphatase)